MFGWAGFLKKYLQVRWQAILGVEIRVDGSVCLVELFAEDGWRVGDRFLLPADESVEDISWQAERIAAKIAAEGLQHIPVVLTAAENEVKGYLISVPPAMEAAEQQEAAYWELDARLGELGLDLEEYRVVCCSLQQSSMLWTAAVRQSYIDSMKQAFEQAGLPLVEIMAVPSAEAELRYDAGESGKIHVWGWDIACEVLPEQVPIQEMAKALRGAVSFLENTQEKRLGEGLLHGKRWKNDWNWPRMAGILAGVAVFGMSSMIGWDSWEYYAARHENWSAKQELARMAPQQDKMRMLERIQEETAGKEKKLQELSSRNIPWYSVLIHFGARTVDGVWLEHLELEGRDKLHIVGRAVSYEALADFVKTFETDRDFFPQAPVLESSREEKQQDSQQAGSISFQMSVSL